MWRTISSKKNWTGVIKNKNKKGQWYYVQTIITPILDHDKNTISYQALCQDITECHETAI